MVLKGGVQEKNRRHGVFFVVWREEWEELEVLVVENHGLYFDITQILSVVLGFFKTKHGITL